MERKIWSVRLCVVRYGRGIMTAHGFTLFETGIGRCGIAWVESRVVAVQLPEAHERKTRTRLLKRCPDAREASPPPAVQRAIDDIVALLRGEASDLSTVALDMDGVPEFDRRVYEIARTIPAGATLSYGEIAARLGERGLARESMPPPCCTRATPRSASRSSRGGGVRTERRPGCQPPGATHI